MNRFSRLKPWLLLAAALLLVPLLETVAAACPTCKDALSTSDPARANLVRGYSYSILFMMSMPFAIIGTFTGLAYRAVKRDARRKAAEAASQSPAASQVPSSSAS
jgi:hypothetical protein